MAVFKWEDTVSSPQLHLSCVYRSFHRGRKDGHTCCAGFQLFIDITFFSNDIWTKCFLYLLGLQAMKCYPNYGWNMQFGRNAIHVCMSHAFVKDLQKDILILLLCHLAFGAKLFEKEFLYHSEAFTLAVSDFGWGRLLSLNYSPSQTRNIIYRRILTYF